MNASEIKARLERALHTSISWAEWQSLKRTGIVDVYDRGVLRTDEENWREFKGLARDHLDLLQAFREDEAREQAGDIETQPGSESPAESFLSSPYIRDDRTLGRALALGTLDRLRSSGDTAQKRPPIYGTLFPRGGIDGTQPHWVSVLAVELWVPADEVKESYRRMQKSMLADPNMPKTQTRTFQVAQFVWENEIADGERPPWPVLWQRWNDSPLGELAGPFKSWRDLRKYFFRGAKATPPNYGATNEQITEQVRLRSHQKAFDIWASNVRE